MIFISPSFGLESFGLTISELAIAETLKHNKRKENVIAYALTLYNPSKTLNQSLLLSKKTYVLVALLNHIHVSL